MAIYRFVPREYPTRIEYRNVQIIIERYAVVSRSKKEGLHTHSSYGKTRDYCYTAPSPSLAAMATLPASCICILSSSIGVVTIIWHAPAKPPASISRSIGNFCLDNKSTEYWDHGGVENNLEISRQGWHRIVRSYSSSIRSALGVFTIDRS